MMLLNHIVFTFRAHLHPGYFYVSNIPLSQDYGDLKKYKTVL